jgi:predicted Zn-dependent protease
MFLDSVYRIRPLPPHQIDKDEPYDGIINDYTICFLYYAMALQERMAALDSEIKSLETTAAAAPRKAVRADSMALAEKRARFSADFDHVVGKLDRCVSLMPWNMQPIHYRHEFLMKFREPKMAEERARKLLLIDPADAQLRRLLAQALDAQGKRKEALELLRKG